MNKYMFSSSFKADGVDGAARMSHPRPAGNSRPARKSCNWAIFEEKASLSLNSERGCAMVSVVGGQEEAPEKMRRRALLHARGRSRCLYGSAKMIFDN